MAYEYTVSALDMNPVPSSIASEELPAPSRDGRSGAARLFGGKPPEARQISAAVVFLPLLAALLMGGLVVFAGPDALLMCIALVASIFILLDFRVGVACLIVLMPLSSSALLPHSIGGITGLNPLNLLLLGTLASCLMQRSGSDARARFSTRPLFWLYVLPFLVAGALGSRHLGEVPTELATMIPQDFGSSSAYLISIVMKPLFIVLFALLVAAAAARSRRPELLVLPMLVSILAMCLTTIVFVINSGAGLSELASSEARTFLSPLGIHANDLGRLYAVAYALMLFTCAASKDAALRAVLIAAMALVTLALTLTFSRGAFFGFVVVNLLFLLSRRRLASILMVAVLLVGVVLALPGAVFERIGSGWGSGLNAISSGRVDEIWLPLLPELWRSPLFGNGLSSIAWSDAMRAGSILIVGHPHNAYLGTLLDIGLIGLALILAYFYRVWKSFRQLTADPSVPPVLRGFYAGAAAGLLSFLLAGFFGSSLTPSLEQIFLWLAIGMMYGQRRPAKEPAPC